MRSGLERSAVTELFSRATTVMTLVYELVDFAIRLSQLSKSAHLPRALQVSLTRIFPLRDGDERKMRAVDSVERRRFAIDHRRNGLTS